MQSTHSVLNSMTVENDERLQTQMPTTTISDAAANCETAKDRHVGDGGTGKTGLPTPPESDSSLEDEADVLGNVDTAGDHATRSETVRQNSHYVLARAHRHHGEKTESLKETRGGGKGFKEAIRVTGTKLKGLLVHGTRA